jgi:hypothetical protein
VSGGVLFSEVRKDTPMLSQAVRDELRAELDHLRAERKRVIARFDAKITALEAILDEPNAAQASLPLSLGAAAAGSNGNGTIQPTGLRETLLNVIRAYPSGLAPVEIARKMEALGFKPGGESPLLHRVHGEVYRLNKAKRLHRSKTGKYTVPVVVEKEPSMSE